MLHTTIAEDASTAHPSRRLRILHILRAPLGGLFRHVCDLALEQTRMGHSVGIVCDAHAASPQCEIKLERIGTALALGVHRVAMSRLLGPRDISALAAIRKLAVKLQPDVLHGHGAKGGAYARLLPKAPGCIALYTPHGGALHYTWASLSGMVFLGLEKLLKARTDGLVFESQFGGEIYEQKIGSHSCPARIVPNGLADGDFAPLEPSEPPYDAVFVGELRKLKGVGTLIDAVAEFAADRPFKLAIAGSGPDEEYFRSEVAERGLEDNIVFLGHRPAREVFAKGRMIVVPSYAESFPYIVLEAIASERPVVATKVGGIPEIFGAYADALVPPGDAAALAKAMRNALYRPAPARARSVALKERARGLFSAKIMAREVTRFYRELKRA